jgi:molybdenum cofactor cytidylyltransferase
MPVAVLPAAGASSRMGCAKLLLPFRDLTILGALTNSLLQSGADPIVLVTAPHDEELQHWAATAGLHTAVNPEPTQGMLSSLLAGLGALGGAAALAGRGEILLVSPADLPLLRSTTVTLLLVRRAAADAQLAVPVYQGRRGHPLVIAPELISEIPGLDPDVGLRQLRERHAAAALEVEVDDPGTVFDVDTPEDYARLEQLAQLAE